MGTGLIAIQASDLTGSPFGHPVLLLATLVHWCTVLVLGVLVAVRAIWFGVRPPLSSLRWALWPGLLVGFSQPTLFTAMKLTSATDVVLLTSLVPLLVSLLAVPILGERPGARFRLWAVLAVIGAGIVAYGGSTGLEGNPAGMAIAGVSLIAWAFYLVFLKIARMHLDAVVLLWSIFAIGGVALTIYVAATGWDIGPVTNRDWLLLAYMTAIPGGIGLLLMTWSYRWLPANVPPSCSAPSLWWQAAWPGGYSPSRSPFCTSSVAPSR